MKRAIAPVALLLLSCTIGVGGDDAATTVRRYLYVASPGIRNYVEWGGKGVLIYDIDGGHRFNRRIPSPFDDIDGKVENIKGICANAATDRLYITSLSRIACIDLTNDKTIWVKQLEGGCDRMAIRPDGKLLYVPSLEGPHWNVIDGYSGDVVKKLTTGQGAHNTVCPPDGSGVYLAGLRSPWLLMADPDTHEIVNRIGPFSGAIRPFTTSSGRQLVIVNVNDLLGFEIGDLQSGRQLHRVEVPGFAKGEVKRHNCPSHGVAVTPDEKEIWVTDAHNQQLHVFDYTALPPRYVASIRLEVDEPGWITFSLDGKYAYPSTGEVIDSQARRILTHLKDENQHQVQSEKMVEIQFAGGDALRVGDQFGVGRAK